MAGQEESATRETPNSSPNTYTIKAILVLRVSTGVRKDVSDEAVKRVLCGAGYQFLHSRKNGLLKKGDLRKKWKFNHKVTKMLTHKFWEKGI